jgi:hypothetical protein
VLAAQRPSAAHHHRMATPPQRHHSSRVKRTKLQNGSEFSQFFSLFLNIFKVFLRLRDQLESKWSFNELLGSTGNYVHKKSTEAL